VTELPARLTVVTLGARNVAKLRDFYRGLGWQLGNDVDHEFASFLLGGVVLAIYRLDLLTAEAAPGDAEPPGWRGTTLAVNVETRDAVDVALRAAVDRGATLVSAAVERDWGGRSGYFADPEGNRWEVAWAPGMTFDERGAVSQF
jgi:catechol 2,3-dioxygenase-like lactoylglutathione lyase family enzyme